MKGQEKKRKDNNTYDGEGKEGIEEKRKGKAMIVMIRKRDTSRVKGKRC